MEQITKIGFYNPQVPEKPLQALTSACESKRRELKDSGDDFRGSLIVLPEAFNIGVPYRDTNDKNNAPDRNPVILSQLQGLCNDFDLCLVAGLIISSPTDPPHSKSLSSVYLVDGSGAGLLGHKRNNDGQGPYQTCTNGCDGHNAIHYRNVALVS